jgi:hypothetical protein
MPTEQNEPQNGEKDANRAKRDDNALSVGDAFGFAWEMGYTMTIPLVALALGGRLLDRYLDTSPVFLLIGIVISIIVSSILLGFKATQIIERTCPVPQKKDNDGPAPK